MNNVTLPPIAKPDRRSRISERSHRWVSIWLGLGVLFALVLFANSLRDYFFVARILSIQEVRHQIAEYITSFEHGLTENVSPDEPLWSSLISRMPAGLNKALWIVLRDPDGQIIEQTGNQGREVFTHDQEITHFRNREPLFDVISSSQGVAVVEVFPVFIRSETMWAKQSGSAGHQGPFVIATEVALPLTAADPATLWPIRRNLIVNAAAAFALLLTVGLTALGFRSYIRGQHLERQLEIAHEVQANLLPRDAQMGGVQLAAEYQPADELAGDFYDTFQTQRGVALLIGDVSGKGLPAALLVGVILGAVRSSKWSSSRARQEQETVALNQLLCERASDDRFATLFWSYTDAECNALHYVNAGHCPPMLVGLRNGKAQIKRLDVGGPALGVLPDAIYVQGSAEIQPGDLMVLYSDGLVEARNEAGEEFGESRLAGLVMRSIQEEPEKIRDSILSAVREFLKHNPAQDDLTCLVARFGTQGPTLVSGQTPEQANDLYQPQHAI